MANFRGGLYSSNCTFDSIRRPRNLRTVREAHHAVSHSFQGFDAQNSQRCVGISLTTHVRGGTAALTILERLSRFDKHRSIQPVAAYPFGGALEVTYMRDCEFSRPTRNNPRRELQVGAEFAYVYVRKTGPEPEMSVKAAPDVKPVIENGFWLNEWLYNAKGMVALVLGQFADPPTELLEGLKRPA
jgi:hypothetical protein